MLPAAAAPYIYEAVVEFCGMKNPWCRVEIPDHIVIFGYVIRVLDIDPVAERQTDVRGGHVVASREIEDRRARKKSTNVDLGDAGLPVAILLEVHAEGSGGGFVQGADSICAHRQHSGIPNGFVKGADGRDAAGPASSAEV